MKKEKILKMIVVLVTGVILFTMSTNVFALSDSDTLSTTTVSFFVISPFPSTFTKAGFFAEMNPLAASEA